MIQPSPSYYDFLTIFKILSEKPMVGYEFLSRIWIHKNNTETDESVSASLCTVDHVLMSQSKMANVALIFWCVEGPGPLSYVYISY